MDVFLGVWDMSAGEFRRGAVGQFRTVSTVCIGVLGCLLAAGSIGCDSVPSELLPETGTGADPTISSENLRSINSAEAVGTEAFKTIQSNQQEIELHFVGDEYAHWYEDTDGYTVVLDAGRYLYAELDDNGELAPTSFLVGEADPAAVGLTPKITPSDDVVMRIRSESTVKPIHEDEPDASELPSGYRIIGGDILVSEEIYEQAKANNSGAVYYNLGQWTGGVVPYEFDANVNSTNQAAMRQAMDDWEAVADVHFIPRTAEANYIHVFSGTGNWSYVGMVGGRQDLSIYNWGWEFIMAHELAHALGIWHEQSRSDRDTYIQINFGNIQSGKEGNFNIHNASWDSDVGTYDFDSIMHYGAYDFSSNGQPTIQTQPAYQGTSFGQRTHLSVSDTAAMATIYGTSVPSVKAAMTTPANNGATLTGAGSSFTFQWNAGANVTEYWLWVGTALDTYDLYNQSAGMNQSATVTNLPTDGSTLYVRVFSTINGQWQHNAYTYVSDNIPSTKAAMTTPASDGATLTGAGSSFTFQWNAGANVTEYWLWVGTALDTYDLYNQSAGMNLSATVTNLPTDGSTLYVRVFSTINGQWQYNAYTYVSDNIPSTKAAMTTPASDGATLTGAGSSFTFQWNAGANVTEYWLWVGTALDTYDLYNQSAGMNQSATVTNLPTDGSTLYVRVFSTINGQWQYNAYTYVSDNIPSTKAAMTTPASDGATLTGAGSSFTFQWNAGANVTEYWLWVGTALDTYDLYNQSAGMNQSATVTNLPTDGSTLYVRVFSTINGQWQHNAYTYVSDNIPSTKAAMTTPASDGATLTGAGSSFTFQWNAGANITEYWLWVGTALDTYDLYNQSAGMNLSATVTNLPTDGSTLYVRVFSTINGQWQHNAYTYICDTVP